MSSESIGMSEPLKIVCLSDTHGLHAGLKVPPGEILIHAGDHCNRGTKGEIKDFNRWLAQLPHPTKLFVAGNHDRPWQFQRKYAPLWLTSATYLQDSGVMIGGLKFWGSPWQPEFSQGWAFNLPRGPQLAAIWEKIPEDVDVLITHTPPQGILDGENLGCQHLRQRIAQLPKLKLHIFGHIHSGYGRQVIDETTFVNAAVCNDNYHACNSPIVFEMPS